MSRLFAPLVLVALLLLGGESRLEAQERERTSRYATADELAAQIDSLRPLVEEARIAAEARTARAREIERDVTASIAKVDTLRIGQLTVITPVDQTARTRDVFEDVWTEDFAHLGESPGLQGATFVFQWDDDRVPIFTELNRTPLEFERWVPRQTVERDIRNSIAAAMTFDLGAEDAQVGRWVSGNPVRQHDMSDVYVQIVTTPSIVTRACLDGSVEACASAMGLGVGGTAGSVAEPWASFELGDPDAWKRFGLEQVKLWYTPEERRALVGSINSFPSRIRGPRDRCVEGDMASCDAIIEERFANLVPLGGSVRESLLGHAISIGGEGAWARVVEDPTMTPEEVIEYAAGEPFEDVVAGWMERVIEARPVTYGSILPNGALALLWVLFFSALALRSTRWRLR